MPAGNHGIVAVFIETNIKSKIDSYQNSLQPNLIEGIGHCPNFIFS